MQNLQLFRISIHFFAGRKSYTMALNTFFSTHIFLADDDAEDRDIFSEALMQVHQEAVLTQFENGANLMDSLNIPPKPMPDVIFLDLNMPGKNGYDCIAEIRADKSMNSYPVVIFTTSSLKDDIDAMYALGANHFVSKPSSFNKLKDVIRKVLHINWDGKAAACRDSFVLSA
jgi:CheY-like chemotaxis protein